jgi:hypothetical protein
MNMSTFTVISAPTGPRMRRTGWGYPLRHYRLWLCLLWGLLSVGCVPSAYVAVSGTAVISPDGERHAAEYPVGDRAERRGKIELWSEGAEREELDGSLQTLIHVGMELHNTSAEPLRLDREQLRLDDVLLENGNVYSAPLATFDGDLEVPPGESRQYQANFRLPSRIWPDDILAYHFTWSVLDSGGTHPQATNFRRSDYDRRVYVALYGPGYPWGYDPWIYPSFRFGFGPPVYRYGSPRGYAPRVYARPRRR